MSNLHSFDRIIYFVLKQLHIRCLDELYWKWQLCLDYFFYFAKMNGTPVPSFDEVRRLFICPKNGIAL